MIVRKKEYVKASKYLFDNLKACTIYGLLISNDYSRDLKLTSQLSVTRKTCGNFPPHFLESPQLLLIH